MENFFEKSVDKYIEARYTQGTIYRTAIHRVAIYSAEEIEGDVLWKRR